MIINATSDPEPSLIKWLPNSCSFNAIEQSKKQDLPSSIFILTLLISLNLTPQLFAAGSTNVGIISHYVWRGISQSNDKPALSGGLDYAFDSGLYAGTWLSSLSGGATENDLYFGFTGETNKINYDVGFISFQYAQSRSHFDELYLNTSFGFIDAFLAYTTSSDDDSGAEYSQGDLYYSIAAHHEFSNHINLNLLLGHYEFDDLAGDDFNNYQLSVSKNNFTFYIDDTTGLNTANEVKFSLSWNKTFEFKK